MRNTGSSEVPDSRKAAGSEVGPGLDDHALLGVGGREHESVTDVEADVPGVANVPSDSGNEHQVSRRDCPEAINRSALVQLVPRVVRQHHACLGPGHHGQAAAVETGRPRAPHT